MSHSQEYTCEDECKKPTWIPAVSALEMTYTDVNFENIGSEALTPPGANFIEKLGALIAPDGRDARGDARFVGIVPKGQGAKCSADYNPIEYLSVGGASPRCVSLNSALKVSTGVMGPPTSRLCYKR